MVQKLCYTINQPCLILPRRQGSVRGSVLCPILEQPTQPNTRSCMEISMVDPLQAGFITTYMQDDYYITEIREQYSGGHTSRALQHAAQCGTPMATSNPLVPIAIKWCLSLLGSSIWTSFPALWGLLSGGPGDPQGLRPERHMRIAHNNPFHMHDTRLQHGHFNSHTKLCHSHRSCRAGQFNLEFKFLSSCFLTKGSEDHLLQAGVAGCKARAVCTNCQRQEPSDGNEGPSHDGHEEDLQS